METCLRIAHKDAKRAMRGVVSKHQIKSKRKTKGKG